MPVPVIEKEETTWTQCSTYDVAGVLLELEDPGVNLLLDELNVEDLLNLLLELAVVGQQQRDQHAAHLCQQHQRLHTHINM